MISRVTLLISCLLLGPALAGRPGEAAPEPADADSAARVRLLSQEQYFNSLAYVFGPDIAVAAHFAPFRRTEGLLESGAAAAGVTIGQMQEFQRTAGAVAEKVVSPASRNFLIPCTPRSTTGADDACAARFLGPVGRLLFRRPLTATEQRGYTAEARAAALRLKDFYGGLAVVLEGMLISPNVLFVVDRTEPDPRHAGRARLDSWSFASRLSLFLWNAAPDDALLTWAAHGDLKSAAGRARAVDYMLASPRLETGVRAFFDDMLGLRRFRGAGEGSQHLPRRSSPTPSATRASRRCARSSTSSSTATATTATSTRLATPSCHRRSPRSTGCRRRPDGRHTNHPRTASASGLLTQVTFLASHAHPGRSSATLRGKALRELLLCQKVPRPPPNVDFSLIEDPKSTLRTARERLAAHRANPVCAGCHKLTDPIGLALENFDGAGQYRATEKGAPIDASGSLDGTTFNDAVGLAAGAAR